MKRKRSVQKEQGGAQRHAYVYSNIDMYLHEQQKEEKKEEGNELMTITIYHLDVKCSMHTRFLLLPVKGFRSFSFFLSLSCSFVLPLYE